MSIQDHSTQFWSVNGADGVDVAEAGVWAQDDAVVAYSSRCYQWVV
jgi:hypothetical protein